MLLLLSLGLPSAYAADVLFVDATPVTIDDFSVAGLFYGMVVGAAEEEGFSFEDADAIHRWAGTDADACWDTDACPGNLWDRTDARMIVVMSVGTTPEGVQVGVRLHNADDTTPFKVLEQTVPDGGEVQFAASIVRTVKDALSLLPARKPMGGAIVLDEEPVYALPDLDEPEPDTGVDTSGADTRAVDKKDTKGADKKGAGTPADKKATDKKADDKKVAAKRNADNNAVADKKAPAVKPPARGDPDTRTRTELRADEERRRMGIPRGAYTKYEASGMSQEDWLARQRVRVGHVWIELGGGYGLGDVDRGYGIRVRLEAEDDTFSVIGTSSWEGSGFAGAPTFAAAVGYSPAWFLDTSVSVGVQYGDKHLDTGWECLTQCEELANEDTYDPVGAVQAIVEPRFRVYPVATGLVKPYVLVGFSVMIHDGFDVPDPEFVDYPSAQGGAAYGPTAGLGVAIDANSRFSFYAEVPASLLFDEPKVVSDGEVDLAPGTLDSGGFLVRFVGGLAVRL